MAQEIQYTNDSNGALEKMKGSDSRANVSARSDGRSYYNSRDKAQSYSIVFDFQSAAAGEFGFYFKNDNTNGLTFVVDSVGLNSVEASRIKLWYVSGTAAAGTLIAPTNLNSASGNTAVATVMEGASAATGITGLTTAGVIDFAYIQATGHEELRLVDRLRIAPNSAFALEYDEGTTGDFSGVVYGYFE